MLLPILIKKTTVDEVFIPCRIMVGSYGILLQTIQELSKFKFASFKVKLDTDCCSWFLIFDY